MNMRMVRYQRSGDPVTDRIISEFPDFDGFDETQPPLVRADVEIDPDAEFGRDTSTKPRKRAASSTAAAKDDKPQQRRRSAAARKQEPPPKAERVGGTAKQERGGVQTEPLLICPQCKCALPEPSHLVSNAMILSGELSVARARQNGAA